MKFKEATIRALVRKNYGGRFDFYAQKLGLHVVWGDRSGPYTSFVADSQEEPCFAIYLGDAMPMFQGYVQPDTNKQPDTVTVVIPTDDLDQDYYRLQETGMEFLEEPQFIEAWDIRCTYFRDPEGNLFELNDASV